eukprot:scaffold9484_cov124-Isochrysis_galbana.AAC.18
MSAWPLNQPLAREWHRRPHRRARRGRLQRPSPPAAPQTRATARGGWVLGSRWSTSCSRRSSRRRGGRGGAAGRGRRLAAARPTHPARTV